MRNKAKCKLCQSIIESFHDSDYVQCNCGEISVSGGAALYCSAKNWHNFLRVDDEDNEIIPTIRETTSHTVVVDDIRTTRPTKRELIEMLTEMKKNIEALPIVAMNTAITHYDYLSLLLLLEAIFRAEDGV